jgi:hypothetical protein
MQRSELKTPLVFVRVIFLRLEYAALCALLLKGLHTKTRKAIQFQSFCSRAQHRQNKPKTMATRSKFRHVFGTQFKRDYCYDNIRATENAWDGQFIKANTQFMAVAWQTSGGGAFAVIPHAGVGRRSAEVPLFAGTDTVHPPSTQIMFSLPTPL